MSMSKVRAKIKRILTKVERANENLYAVVELMDSLEKDYNVTIPHRVAKDLKIAVDTTDELEDSLVIAYKQMGTKRNPKKRKTVKRRR